MILSYILYDFESDTEDDMGLFSFTRNTLTNKQSQPSVSGTQRSRRWAGSLDKAGTQSGDSERPHEQRYNSSTKRGPPPYTKYDSSETHHDARTGIEDASTNEKSRRSSSTLASSHKASSGRKPYRELASHSNLLTRTEKATVDEEVPRGRNHGRVRRRHRRRRSSSTSSDSSSSSSSSSNSNHSFRNKLKRRFGRY